MVATIAALVAPLAVAMALPWIEDRDYGRGTYTGSYAYVGAYTTGEKLVNIKHYGSVTIYDPSGDVVAVVYKHVSSDYSSAYTKVLAFHYPPGSNEGELDSYAYAYIEASIILEK